jgi:hypothetical protein
MLLSLTHDGDYACAEALLVDDPDPSEPASPPST